MLFTGPSCSLCDVFKARLDDLRGRGHSFELSVANIRDPAVDKAYRRLYQYHIPVLAFEGQEIMRSKWNEDKLLDRLARWKAEEGSFARRRSGSRS